MQVNASNAKVVAAILAALVDQRFNMRTLDAIRRDTDIESDDVVLTVASEMGAPILHRIRDNAPLVARPIVPDGSRRMTHAECAEWAEKARAVAEGGDAFDMPTFRVTFVDESIGDDEPSDETGEE